MGKDNGRNKPYIKSITYNNKYDDQQEQIQASLTKLVAEMLIHNIKHEQGNL